jgi:cytochrome c oxidase assembly protein subunit 15
VQLIHRLGAVFLLPVLIVLGLVAWRRGRQRGGALLLGLTIAQPMLGLLMVHAGLPLVPALLHNLVAALLLATLVRLV